MNNQKILVCSIMKFAHVRDVENIINGIIYMKPGTSLQRIISPAGSLTETFKQNKAGDSVLQRLSIPLRTDEISPTLYLNPKLIFEISFSNGHRVVWGSHELPVRLNSLNTSEGEARTTFDREALGMEFL